MKMGAWSERLYKKKMSVKQLEEMLWNLNDYKIDLYHRMDSVEKLNTTFLRDTYGVNTYYANIVLRNVKAVQSSSKEQYKLLLDEYERKIGDKETQIEQKAKNLSFWKEMKSYVVSLSLGKEKCKTVFPYQFRVDKNEIVVINRKTVYSLSEFEQYIDKRISTLKNNLRQQKDRLNRLKQQKEQLRERKICFGSRKLFKQQWTTDISHDEWKAKWKAKRHSSFVLSGCNGFTGGSMVARYEDGILSIMKPTRGEMIGKYERQSWFQIPVEFVYNKEYLLSAIEKRETVSYEIKDCGEYFLIMATMETEKPVDKMLTTMEMGAVGIDINGDRFALVDIDKNGNFLQRKVVSFNLLGLSGSKALKEIELAVKEAVRFVKSCKKPVVCEDLKHIKFKDMKNSIANQKISSFAYQKILQTLERTLYKEDIWLYKINPMYTSQFGKVKYMGRFGMSVHESAAFCIARRGLFSTKDKMYIEKLKEYRQYGHSEQVVKTLKEVTPRESYFLHQLDKTTCKTLSKVKKLTKEQYQILRQTEKQLQTERKEKNNKLRTKKYHQAERQRATEKQLQKIRHIK